MIVHVEKGRRVVMKSTYQMHTPVSATTDTFVPAHARDLLINDGTFELRGCEMISLECGL